MGMGRTYQFALGDLALSMCAFIAAVRLLGQTPHTQIHFNTNGR